MFLTENSLLEILQLGSSIDWLISQRFCTIPLCHLHYALEMRINDEFSCHPPQSPTSIPRLPTTFIIYQAHCRSRAFSFSATPFFLVICLENSTCLGQYLLFSSTRPLGSVWVPVFTFFCIAAWKLPSGSMVQL